MNWIEAIKQMPKWSFGDSSELADELAQLVLDGKKTATSGLYFWYQTHGESVAQVGDRACVTWSNGNPACVIEITTVEQKPFGAIDDAFARAEGEGDLSLEYWRQAHREFFDRSGLLYSDESLVVCEHFKVLHRFKTVKILPLPSSRPPL